MPFLSDTLKRHKEKFSPIVLKEESSLALLLRFLNFVKENEELHSSTTLLYPGFLDFDASSSLVKWELNKIDEEKIRILINRKYVQDPGFLYNLGLHLRIYSFDKENSISYNVVNSQVGRVTIRISKTDQERYELIQRSTRLECLIPEKVTELFRKKFCFTSPVIPPEQIIGVDSIKKFCPALDKKITLDLFSFFDEQENKFKKDVSYSRIPSFYRELIRPILYHLMFLDSFDLYYVFSAPIAIKDDVTRGLGGFFLLFDNKDNEEKVNSYLLPLYEELCDTIAIQITYKQLTETIITANKNVSLLNILARNFSHNIGSHVIHRATLEKIFERLNRWNLKERSKITEGYLDFVIFIKNNLDTYIQKRNEFLAFISSEPISTSKTAYLYRDVIVPFIENTLLLDNIAANENISYIDDERDSFLNRNRLKILVFIDGIELTVEYPEAKPFRSQPIQYPYNFPYYIEPGNSEHPGGKKNTQSVFNNRVIHNRSYDVQIDLPGPLGEHAFYSFLENYIRNAAKHREIQENEELLIKIQIETKDPDPNYCRIRISDNLSQIKENEYETIQNAINSDLIHEDGSPIRENLGIADMKICATLLKGSSDFSRSSMIRNLEFRRNGQFGYQFYLKKSKKVCFFTRRPLSQLQRELLENGGFHFFHVLPSYENKDDRTLSTYKFALLDEEVLLDFCKQHDRRLHSAFEYLLKVLPFRVILLTQKGFDTLHPQIQSLVENKQIVLSDQSLDWEASTDQILKMCWESWLKRWPTFREGVNLNVFLQQKKGEYPTRDWIACSKKFKNTQIELNILTNEKDSGIIRKKKHSIFYDRHGKVITKAGFDSTVDNLVEDHSYVFFDKTSLDFSKIFYPQFPASGEEWLFPYELIEAGLLRILIVDERVAEHSIKRYEDTDSQKIRNYGFKIKREQSVSAFDIAWAANVHICTHFGFQDDQGKSINFPLHKKVDLGKNIHHFNLKVIYGLDHSGQKELHLESRTNIERFEKIDLQYDSIIIHRTVLNTLADKLNVDTAEFISLLKKKIPFVVVTSGGGKPHSIPGAFKFLPFSILDNYCQTKRLAKYSLSQQLLSL